MSISNYGELKIAVASWLARSNLTARIPEFISIAEGYIHYGIMAPNKRWAVEPLRIRAMETAADITIAAQTASLPEGWLAARRFYLDGANRKQLDFLPPTDFWSRELSSTTGTPTAYTIEGEDFVFGPIGGGTGKLLYYKKFDALSDDSDTNWLLTNQPGAYLFAALYEAFSYAEGGQQESDAYLMKFSSIINALNAADNQDRYSGAILQMRAGATP
jgi:hypothetical protein